MHIAEARTVLGLGPDEDPRPHLPRFRETREHLATMVREAPNETIALRFQDSLIEFDQALAAVREHLEILGIYHPRVPASPVLPESRERTAVNRAKKPAAPWQQMLAAGTLLILVAAAISSWIYFKIEDDRRLELKMRLLRLEREGGQLIDERRWQEAERKFLEIERLQPGTRSARVGRRTIEAGMAEELSQAVAYWTGEARAALDGGRWDDAEHAARQVLNRYPRQEEMLGLLEEIQHARDAAALEDAIAYTRELLARRDFDGAIAAAAAILDDHPRSDRAHALHLEMIEARETMLANLLRARELHALAAPRDIGVYDKEALEWLREAAALAPDDGEIAAALEKMSSYVRTLRVPEEFATVAEAVADARDRDRIVIGNGTWEGPIVVNVAIELQGASAATTNIVCDAHAGSAITFGPNASGAHISGISFLHTAFDPGPERYSAAMVRGGSVEFADCRFADASGHGLVVVESGKVIATRCRFIENGWNGIAATGEGSLLEVRESECRGNFGNGIEAWDGASVILSRNRCEENTRNGIHADGGTASATIEKNVLAKNREFGLVLGRVASGRVTENVARENLLGGLVIRSTAGMTSVTTNQAIKNLGPGLVLEAGLNAALFSQNSASGNLGAQILNEADFTPAPEIPDKLIEEDPAAALRDDPPVGP
jgi:nitrous oxidase accessory protein NosD